MLAGGGAGRLVISDNLPEGPRAWGSEVDQVVLDPNIEAVSRDDFKRAQGILLKH